MIRLSNASKTENYRKAIQYIKDESYKSEPVMLKSTVIGKDFNVRQEILKALVNLDILIMLPGEGTHSRSYRWAGKNTPIDDKFVAPVLTEVYKITSSYASQLAKVGKPKKDKEQKYQKAHKEVIPKVKSYTGTLFSVEQLAYIKSEQFSKPTSIKIDNIEFDGITEIEYHVEGDKLVISLLSEATDSKRNAFAKITYHNVSLAFSRRGPSGVATNSLYVEVVRR